MRAVRKALWTMLLVAALGIGATILYAAGNNLGSDRSSSARRTAAPLPPATAVTARTDGTPGTDPVRGIPSRPTRIRVELYGTAATADISFSVRRSGDSSDPTELVDHALPWAAELDAPGDADYISVTGYTYDADTDHQLLCRLIVGGVVVEAQQKANYARCSLSLGDLDG